MYRNVMVNCFRICYYIFMKVQLQEHLGCVSKQKAGTTVHVDQDASDGDVMEEMKVSYQVLRDEISLVLKLEGE